MEKKDFIGLVFIALIVITLLGIAMQTVTTSQQTRIIDNETFTFAASVELNYDNLLELSDLINSTGQDEIGRCNVTLTTGILICNTTGSFSGFADYEYYPDTYVAASGIRALIGLISVVLVIIVILWIKKQK